MDFVHDQLALGNTRRILTIVDTHSRFCPRAHLRFNYRGEDVVRTLERVCAKVGYPKTIQVENGSEFTSRDLDLWVYANDVTLNFSRHGRPNGLINAFNNNGEQVTWSHYYFVCTTNEISEVQDALISVALRDSRPGNGAVT